MSTTTTKAPDGPSGRLTWTHALSALRHRSFRWLFVGTFISNAGSWMQKVATSWLIYQMTGSEAWLGLDAFASGFAFVGTMIRLGTALLQVTPDEFRGRVTSLQQMCFRAAQPFGALVAGLVAARLGIRVVFWVFGGLLVGIVPVLLAIGFSSLPGIAEPVAEAKSSK